MKSITGTSITLQTLLALTAAIFLKPALATASGCGSYDLSRTVIEKTFAYQRPQNFSLVSRTAELVTLKSESTGKTYDLKWERTEASDDVYDYQGVDLYDVMFEEGHGCGPIYRCVTGQIVFRITDAKNRTTTTFTYPQVLETTIPTGMTYIVDSPLLDAFGSMKLDTTPLSHYRDGGSMNPDNFNRCGYGSW